MALGWVSHLLLKRKSRQYYMVDSLDSSSDSIMGAAAICVWFFFFFEYISPLLTQTERGKESTGKTVG
jgi:hypothetical protein